MSGQPDAAPIRAYLLELLQGEHGRLRAEVYRTEGREFKDELKAREETLQRLIGRLTTDQPGRDHASAPGAPPLQLAHPKR